MDCRRRPVVGRRARAPDGWRRQVSAGSRRPAAARSCHRTRSAAGRRDADQREWRAAAVCGVRLARGGRRGWRVRRAARRHSGWFGMDAGQRAVLSVDGQRSHRRPVRSRRLGCPVGGGRNRAGCRNRLRDVGGRTHPVFGLWPVRLADDLRRALVEEDVRKIDRWTARYRVAYAEWATVPVDPFFNVNRPDDLAAAERLAAVAI